ncbi:MAG TPA: hypothetical protein VFB36_05820 [Nevskiaceae bacterium]|nr:hypothetical protein [Nevskiaceae bacterium]
MKQARAQLLLSVATLTLAACGASKGVPQPSDSTQSPATGAPLSRYDMANRCFVAKANGAYIARDGASLIANAPSADAAEHFYMKPAGLGRYIFYTKDAQYMTAASNAGVSCTGSPADGSDWTVNGDQGQFTATALDRQLSLDDSKHLGLGTVPASLQFEPSEGCTEYPEMPVDVTGPAFKNAANGPVIGFAEVHSHMGMGSEMSDGSGHVGPSAGGGMYGQAINRFGVVEALKNCEGMHGPDGILSGENIVLDQNPTETHDTVGWPTFIGWPQRDSELHQQMYYKWVERAYRAGLRTMVIHGTNIEALCNVQKLAGGNKDPNLLDEECGDMEVGLAQVDYVHAMQDYIDAQEGGPGKGWFRIVSNPTEARAVIAEGKMAVIPGLEFSNIFHCNVVFNPDGSETDGCTKEQIDREIDEVWDRGVRAVFPYHDVDSALGGTGIFSSALNLVGFAGTHGFWKTYACDDGGEGDKWFYAAGTPMESAPLTGPLGPVGQMLVDLAAGRLPIYGPGRQCNARGVTELGKYAIDKIMKKGFTLDIDHAEVSIKQYMLDQGAKTTPNYPMISAHGGHGGISNAQVVQIYKQGGIVYPAIENGKDMVGYMNRLKPLFQQSGSTRTFAMGYGADSNGLRNLPGPRGAGTTPIEYPFTLFRGPGWGPQFSGVEPVTVDELSIPGGQSWNMDEVGMAHYGLVADIAEEIRIEGGQDAVDAFYNSAEMYLEMWEQTLAASQNARTLPLP